MTFLNTPVDGAFLIRIEAQRDDRGFFARTWCRREFEGHGLTAGLVQCNISFNYRRGTLRGLHYQAPPFEEVKLVRCIRGALHDVILDLRPQSPTYLRHFAAELSAENRDMMYVPAGVAHGFLTLADDTEVLYQMSQFYSPEHSRGVRWNDPAFAINWPHPVQVIAERDRTYPDFTRCMP